MSADPLILFVPGLRPKPEPVTHRRELFRCLLEGIRRIDADVATTLAADRQSFEIASWTYDFYGEHRAIGLDQADIYALLKKQEASAADLALGIAREIIERKLYDETFVKGHTDLPLLVRMDTQELLRASEVMPRPA